MVHILFCFIILILTHQCCCNFLRIETSYKASILETLQWLLLIFFQVIIIISVPLLFMLPVVFLTLSKPKVFLFTYNYALDPQEILAPHFTEWKSNTCTPSITIGEDNIFITISREAGNTKVDISFWETFSKPQPSF